MRGWAAWHKMSLAQEGKEGIPGSSSKEGSLCGGGISTEKNQYSLFKDLIPRLRQGNYNMNLKHLLPRQAGRKEGKKEERRKEGKEGREGRRKEENV